MRPVAVAVVLLAVLAASAGAATHTYSTGTIRVAIPDGGTVERGVAVPDRGPVGSVSVGLRIAHPHLADLTLSLVSPAGTVVRLMSHAGADGADAGTGARGCNGSLLYFSDGSDPVSGATTPLDGAWGPESPLARVNGEQARGRWTLRISDDVPG